MRDPFPAQRVAVPAFIWISMARDQLVRRFQAAVVCERYTRSVQVPARDREIVRALAAAWAKLRRQDTRIRPAIWYLTGGKATSCANGPWDEDELVLRVNLRLKGQNADGVTLFEELAHWAAHSAVGISLGAEGRWHSEEFGRTAEALGLVVEKGIIGWVPTGELAPGAAARYRNEIRAQDAAMKLWAPVGEVTRRGPVKMVCGCSPAANAQPQRILRVTSGVADEGQIRCEICGAEFVRVPG